MPPIPVECLEHPIAKSSRTRLNFGQPTTEMGTSSLYPDVKLPDMNTLRDGNSIYTRRASTPVKRSLVLNETTANVKRTKYSYSETTTEGNLSPTSNIIKAVERLSTKSDLIADGSRDNILPTIPGKHSDLRSITPDTMSAILDGVYDDKMDSVTIIDCRYPYEFEGGHIQGAINLYTKGMIETFLKENVVTSNKTHVLIFHCEFSSERGPKMYRFLRSLDRELNKDNYPRLNFPEIYLLEGGYKAFFYQNQDKCYPQSYKPMLHKEHKEELRHFRVKSKSWSAGEKTHARFQVGAGLRLRF